MSDLKSYYRNAVLVESIKSNEGLLSDIDERVLFTRDDASAKFLQMILENYPYWHPDMPVEPEESEIVQDITRYNKTLNVMDKLRKGNISEIQAMSGIDTDGIEATGLDNLEEELKEPAKLIYLYAQMGKGKTFLASLMGNVFLDWVQREYDADVTAQDVLASNITSYESTYAHKIIELLEWLKSNDLPKLFIFDEASLYANSLLVSNTQQAYATILPLVILIRRYNGRIIFIGHSGSDLGKQMRDMATPVRKDSKTRATVYEGIDEQGEPYGKKYSLYAIPEMLEGAKKRGLVPDTQDKGAWEWTDDDREIIEDEMAGNDLSDYSDKFGEEPTIPVEESGESAGGSNGGDSSDYSVDYPDDVTTQDEKINYLYNIAGMTQQEVADYLDISVGTVNRYL